MERTDLGREIETALGEVLAHVRGETGLSCRIVDDPAASRIVALRKRLRLSRQKFADRFGLDVRVLQEWEQGRRVPDRAASSMAPGEGRQFRGGRGSGRLNSSSMSGCLRVELPVSAAESRRTARSPPRATRPARRVGEDEVAVGSSPHASLAIQSPRLRWHRRTRLRCRATGSTTPRALGGRSLPC